MPIVLKQNKPTPFIIILFALFCFKSFSTVIITGSNGVLGSALVRQALLKGLPTVIGLRDRSKLHSVIEKLKETGKYAVLSPLEKITVRTLRAEQVGDQQIANHLRGQRVQSNVVLFNNAAVCLEGIDHPSLQESIQTNAIFPAYLAQQVVENIGSEQNVTVVNVSSGDGELVFLNSEIRAQIESVASVRDWYRYTHYLLSDKLNYNQELAVGPTPAYSISKALLNAFTRVYNAETAPKIRVVSVCPGNFASPMSTAGQLLDSACYKSR